MILVLAYVGVGLGVGAFLWRRTFKAIVLPLVFLVLLAPNAAWVASGKGTHMSPLLLYPFALPWGLLGYQEGVAGSEVRGLFVGCLINAILLVMAGAALDLRASRRRLAAR